MSYPNQIHLPGINKEKGGDAHIQGISSFPFSFKESWFILAEATMREG